ncbi:hypothetical protein K469DRAFT_604079 [Zopfia rhizophila CBS 207.26]|uniref:Zn(2)-C6 fungal-type domain-containing protein n=1 Tax=Zopfia rhizophila CBS 207.26 TaxID=1314779 RepID=A0A6A6DDM0_9PEZI|nr:hypothetical protein K469DRAFT_604079 [Zopfia rhizophila CBS 207.26]
MAVGVERRARKAASRLDQALLLRPTQGNAMSYNPLPNTTRVGLPVIESTSIHNSRDRLDFDPTLPGQIIPPAIHSQSNKKRRPSKGKVPPEIRRSSSTPHMRNLALATSGELSPTADKRRNKLGYHRTSVACGHCRRRKIRCLVAQDDHQGRCSNCIRLKKECNFYPVEQNPENQRSQTTSAKETATGAPASSTTSSPRQPPSVPGEKIEEYRPPYSGALSGAPASRFGAQTELDVDPTQIPHSSGLSLPHPPYTYPHSNDTQWSTPGFLPSSSVAESSPSSSGYWRPSPSTANSTYGSESNMSGGQTPATMSTTSNISYSGHPEGHSWGPPNFQPPTRSMSYGNIEGLPQQYSSHGLGIQQHDYPRRTSPYPYPTSIDTNPATIHTTTLAGATSAPLSAPILPGQPYGYPQTWNPYAGMQNPAHDMPVQGRSMSAQWYAEPTPLDQVQEEGGPPTTYSHGGMQHFYSGP